uniref:Glyoxylate reductase/hydroxypyruvate reductase n=1 Tax=Rhipicephalus pulchellus TaxID=72859 RepID=L7M4F5_RHIPC
MSRPKVYVTRPDIPAEPMAKLRQNCDVTNWDKEEPVNHDVLIENVRGKDGLLCMLTDKINKDVIAAGDKLKIIATMSVGFEHIDLEECKKRNIIVTNTPNVSSDSVAEMTIAMALAAGRRIVDCANAVKQGEWIYSWGPMWMVGQGLHGATVGFVGMGHIAQCVLRGMIGLHIAKALYYDKFHPIKPAEELGAVFTSLDDLAAQADFIVTLTNLTDETRGMYNKSFFSKMKKTAVFVNCSRGGVVNQDDLYDALKNGVIRAAAIDVAVPEPLPKTSKLLTLRNLIVTPHIGSAEISVRIKMGFLAVDNTINVLNGQAPATKPVVPHT